MLLSKGMLSMQQYNDFVDDTCLDGKHWSPYVDYGFLARRGYIWTPSALALYVKSNPILEGEVAIRTPLTNAENVGDTIVLTLVPQDDIRSSSTRCLDMEFEVQ